MFKSLARSAALGIVAAGAGAAGVGVGAFALFALLKNTGLGQSGAAAVVAILFLLVALVAAMMMRGGGHKTEAHAQGPSSSPLAALTGGGDIKDRAIAFARQRPLIAGGVGLLGALYVLRNPALVTGIIGLLAGRVEGKQEARRGWF